MLSFIIGVLEQGALYAFLSIGVMLTYKILGVSDLSVDGTFPLGAVVSAVVIVKWQNPWLGLLGSLLAGMLAGAITGILHVKLKISSLLSGILVMTALYSINLMIAGGSSNIPLLNEKTLFDTAWLAPLNPPPFVYQFYNLFILVGLLIIVKLLIDWILSTKFGYLLKVTGDNEGLVTSLGHDVGAVKIMGLSLANGLVALSGGIAASVGNYYDVTLGTGMVVMGLASVMLGTLILGKTKFKPTSMVIVGSIIYRLIVGIAIRFEVDSRHLRLVTVIIVLVTIIINNFSSSLSFGDKKGDSDVKL